MKVVFDRDLALLYGSIALWCGKKFLNQAVKRNIDRFPFDFIFRLSSKGV